MLQDDEWKVIHLDHSYNALGEVAPGELDFSIFLSKIGGCTYNVDLDHAMATEVNTTPYRTDYLLCKGSRQLQGGIHTGIDVDLGNEVLQVTGNDYLHYLEKRWYPFDPTSLASGGYSAPINSDLATIVTALLDNTLAVSGSLALTYTLAATGQLINDFKIALGDTEWILQKIETLSKRNPGFDYEITPQRQFKMYAPKKGSLRDFAFDSDRNMTPVNYSEKGPNGTHTLVIAQGQSNRRAAAVTSGAVAAYRRLDAHEDLSSTIVDATTLASIAAAESERNITPIIEFSAKYIPEEGVEIWDEVSIGDTVKCRANLQYKMIDDYFRVIGIQCQVDNSGNEEITYTFDNGTTPQ